MKTFLKRYADQVIISHVWPSSPKVSFWEPEKLKLVPRRKPFWFEIRSTLRSRLQFGCSSAVYRRAAPIVFSLKKLLELFFSFYTYLFQK
jgi:hypothetical protein